MLRLICAFIINSGLKTLSVTIPLRKKSGGVQPSDLADHSLGPYLLIHEFVNKSFKEKVLHVLCEEASFEKSAYRGNGEQFSL